MLFTPTVIKNLLKKPATRNYPFVVREPFPNFRGELVIDIEKCIFCGMCERKCPSQCITVDKQAGTWQCDPHACISCGYCRDNCPTKCLTMNDTHRKPMAAKVTWIEQGTPPKPKAKKAAAEKKTDEE
ncbi:MULTISPECIES: 4Fe-4S binding protein [unclassified Pseudodesulfovibrio]|uniref:4Fe-4S binding protein n=1 Tax=unclassified Pseudodesulfovibrio TaxID=2661612 RepID=UPI000FEBCD58|nr:MULTISPECIES: 4Fe-4S binding protein [unclassified Pseudodesulfovibrio]MCJ2164476.1 4Fe-4S binding protein [Pseudodesulfovibrio sp. S3-i]RWU04676.1 4Fe-4S dicluster domain-containing protein [Pseudodesulfovibrio sp. S3]